MQGREAILLLAILDRIGPNRLTVLEGGITMLADKQSTERIPGYCALCVSRCGSIAVIENGRFVSLEPDPSHPTGKALCAKGRAAPELVYHPDRLLYPLKRTRPKGDPDPGWARISWDEALHLSATGLLRIAARYHACRLVSAVGGTPR